MIILLFSARDALVIELNNIIIVIIESSYECH